MNTNQWNNVSNKPCFTHTYVRYTVDEIEVSSVYKLIYTFRYVYNHSVTSLSTLTRYWSHVLSLSL